MRTFFKQYGGSSWSRAAKENWLVAGQRISTWAGVTTDEGGKHVTALELRGRLPKLKGKPEKQQALVALLKRLRQLDLQTLVNENSSVLVSAGFRPKALDASGVGWPCVFERTVQAKTQSNWRGADKQVAGQFDTKGVLYLLGTHAGARKYKNPMKSGEIVAAMSSAYTDSTEKSAPWKLVEHAHPGGNDYSNYNRTDNKPGSWISIDLGASRALRLTHYALRHGRYFGYDLLRSWRLEGSNDPSSGWVTLKEHKDDESLPAQGWCVGDWAVEGIEQEYRHFRIIQTGKNSNGNDYLMCAGIELYGELRADKPAEVEIQSLRTIGEPLHSLSRALSLPPVSLPFLSSMHAFTCVLL